MDNFIDVSNIMVNAMEEHEVLSASGDNSMLGNMTNQKWWSEQSEEIKKYIEDNDKIFFCEWNGDIGEIHTEQSMYEKYKDTNLYDREQFYGNQTDFSSYEDFETLVKYAGVEEVNTEDNMMIVRLK